MNHIILTDLLTGLWAKGPDYVLLFLIVAAFFILRDLYLANRRQARINTALHEKQDDHEKKLSSLEVIAHEFRDFRAGEFGEFRDEFREFRLEMRHEFKELRNEFHGELKELREEFHGEFKEIRSDIKEIRSEIEGVKSDIIEIKGTLKDIENRFKLSDFKHDALESRVTKLESADEKTPKS